MNGNRQALFPPPSSHPPLISHDSLDNSTNSNPSPFALSVSNVVLDVRVRVRREPNSIITTVLFIFQSMCEIQFAKWTYATKTIKRLRCFRNAIISLLNDPFDSRFCQFSISGFRLGLNMLIRRLKILTIG